MSNIIIASVSCLGLVLISEEYIDENWNKGNIELTVFTDNSLSDIYY